MKTLNMLFVLFLTFILSVSTMYCIAQSTSQKTLWQIGNEDNGDTEFALAPSGFDSFLSRDFGWEDGYYLIGNSETKKDWPYILPGPQDEWGGSTTLAGWHAASANILF